MVDHDEVGGVALGNGDRGGVRDRDGAERQRRNRCAKAAVKRDDERHDQHDGPVERHDRGQQRADAADERVEDEAVATRVPGERDGGAVGEPGARDQRRERERRREERDQRRHDRERGRDASAERDIERGRRRDHCRRDPAAWFEDERGDRDGCETEVDAKHGYWLSARS